MKHLTFLLIAIGGFVLSIAILALIIDIGEGLDLSLLTRMLVWITAVGFPLSILTDRITLARQARHILPLIYGFLWLFCFLFLGSFTKSGNSLRMEVITGILTSLVSSALSVALVKVGDLVLNRERNGKEKEK